MSESQNSPTERNEESGGMVEALLDLMVGLAKTDHRLNAAHPNLPEITSEDQFQATRHHGYIAVFDDGECVMKLNDEKANELVDTINKEVRQ